MYSVAANLPLLSVIQSLTGLLSFMLSEEMTTGSMSLTAKERQILAERSHSWNINQPRFRTAFPDVSLPYFDILTLSLTTFRLVRKLSDEGLTKHGREGEGVAGFTQETCCNDTYTYSDTFTNTCTCCYHSAWSF